ncbi:MAG: hypothetical protein Q7S55_04980 [Nanoarchaeota archaeon]|nr:hypothetical protein [Nanoarchaeota archaeon]
MKIITPEEFEAERKDNLLYVGRIRAADYIWVHRSGGDHSSANLERLARDLQGDILVTQTVNADDWSWASNDLSGKVGMDDHTFVAAAELYRDSTIDRKAEYLSSELLAQIEPQLDDLGPLGAEKSVGLSYNEYGAESKLLEEANKKGADYVVLESNGCQEFHLFDLPEFVAISSGRIYRLKRAEIKSDIKVISAPDDPTLVSELRESDSIALDYATRLLNGDASGTVLDWKKH